MRYMGSGRVFTSITTMTLVDYTYAVFVLAVSNKYKWLINGNLHAITFPVIEKKLNIIIHVKFYHTIGQCQINPLVKTGR